MVHAQIKDIGDYFVEAFQYPSRERALAHLDRSHNPMRTKDAVVLMYFAGLLTIIIFLIVVIVSLPLQSGSRFNAIEEFLASLYTFRFLFTPITLVLASALCIKVFVTYKINFIFIMELDPHKKITHIQLFRVSLN